MSAAEIIQGFIASGYRHMQNIPQNRVFLTDHTSSTLAWLEGNVVIEYYLIFLNVDVPMHAHPFDNQMIFLGGDLTATRELARGPIVTKQFKDADINGLSSVMPSGFRHGFETGDRGCAMYNIQIWDQREGDALSAALQYLGPSMGPIHDRVMKHLRTTS